MFEIQALPAADLFRIESHTSGVMEAQWDMLQACRSSWLCAETMVADWQDVEHCEVIKSVVDCGLMALEDVEATNEEDKLLLGL